MIEASGWVRKIRKHKNTTFIELNNGILNKNMQFLMTSSMNPPKINEAVKLTFKRENNHLTVFKIEKYLRGDDFNINVIAFEFDSSPIQRLESLKRYKIPTFIHSGN